RVRETSLLELFESALGRPCHSGYAPAARPLPPELALDEWPIEVAEPEPFDAAIPATKPGSPAPWPARLVTPALLISIGLHVIPVATLLAWPSAAPETPAPIPVQLVIEQ